MIRALEDREIERILRAEVIGRIGCHVAPRTYVVPVSFVYEDGAVYAHSAEGRKIEMMRQNPSVCFEVDHVEDLVNWYSVVCRGEYEELYGEQAEHGLQVLRERLQEVLPRRGDHGLAADKVAGGSPVVFRINLSDASGREERLQWELLPPVARVERAPVAAASIHADGFHTWSDMVPEDVLAERDAEARGMVSLPAESDR